MVKRFNYASFNNALDIQNIISRVTGGSVSNIDGIIRTLGTANLFLINPNGIVFGQNAQLNVGGSFLASTANALQFGNRGFFSATEQNISSPLLTINPSALLFNQINQNAAIQNSSVAFAGTDPAGFDALGLRVPNGKSLLLVGGNVSMDGGRLNANGGQVELGGLAEPGTVLLGVDGDNLSLKFPDNVARTSVSFTNQAGIYVTGAGEGNLAVNARNLEILGGSILSGGIGRGLGTPETVAGDITLNATESIKVAGTGSNVRNLVRLGSLGNGGNIIIESGSFSLSDGTQISTSTGGLGNAGNVTVRAKNTVDLADNAAILSTVAEGGVGKGGNIGINGATLSLIDGAQLLTITREASATAPAGRGDAGNINVNVTGAVDIAGRNSGIGSAVETGTVGNGGDITIDSGSFSLRDDAQLIASTLGLGNAGNVTMRAKNTVDLASGDIFSTVERGGVGKGGNIDINAATLSLIDGAQLLTITRKASATAPGGRGDAGNINVNVTGAVDIAGRNSGIGSAVETGTVGNGGDITIDSGSFSLRDDAQLTASTSGLGNAGNVTVRAQDAVSLADNTAIFSTVESGGVGNGGNIDINAATLSLTDGAQLLTITRGASATQPPGRGDAGNVNVNVKGIIDIAGEKNGFPSRISSNVGRGTVGNGGNITIDSGSFSLQDGAQLEASTYGQGNAGNVTMRAKNAVSLANANIFSTVESGGVGKGGNIDINGATLSLIDGAGLATITRGASATAPAGRGDAGNINVNVTGAVDIAGEKNDSSSGIFSSVRTGTVGNGGNITIDSGSFSLRDRAQLSASTRGQGNAGNVTVGAKNTVSLADADIFSTVESGGVGKGGNIDINAATLSLTDGAQLQTGTRGASATQPAGIGNAGNVNVLVTGNVDITGQKNGNQSGISSNVGRGTVGNGGSITIDSGSFSLRDGAALTASTYGQGNAGNVNVLVTGAVDIAGQKNGNQSGILSVLGTGAVGNGGSITIDSGSFSLRDDAGLSVSIFGQGNAGNVTVGARNAVFIASNAGIFSTVEKGGVGKGGNIDINSPKITLDNQGQINAETASGNGGNININSDLLLLRRNSQIITGAGTEELGSDLLLRRNSQIITGAGTEELGSDLLLHRNSQFTINAGTKKLDGDGGNININSKFIVAVPNENSDISANAFTGAGGRVSIKANGIYGIEFRKSPTLLSDITASSEFGTQGTVELNTPGIDPNSGLVALPTVAVDTQIAQGCYSPGYAQNSFIITGRGGLPPNPREAFSSNIVRPEWATLAPSNDINSQQTIKENPPIPTPPAPIVEATGWGTNTKGEIVLTANASAGAPHKNWQQSPVTCSSAKSASN
ncbi:MAG: S-layer family protein [Nostoc indistinguendum CM1-VF10]|nr:S-layer family protein [Nostoc indistinguendum CM1-VF10]